MMQLPSMWKSASQRLNHQQDILQARATDLRERSVCVPPHSLGREEDADVAVWLFKGPSGPPVWDQLQDTTETKLMI